MEPRDAPGLWPQTARFSALIVSDSRTEADDASGDTIERLTTEAGHRLVERRIVPDDIVEIARRRGRTLRCEEVDVLVFSGGAARPGT